MNSASIRIPKCKRNLRVLITQRGWSTHRVYSDRASGAKERRPGLDALMADARRGLFDVVIVWRFDPFARSVKQRMEALEEFHSLGIDFISHQEALDTSTPMGRMVFTVIAAMAELERVIIRERAVAGVEPAQRNGTKSGKPIGRPRAIVDADQVVHFNKTCFTAAPVLVAGNKAAGFGNSGVGIVRGPGQANFDVSIGKQFPIRWPAEHGRLELRSEFFNAFNHTQFVNPGLNSSTATFGIIAGTSVPARMVQFALKYAF
jgi:DNA invertase Pin-like site-specific DNA recombinase